MVGFNMILCIIAVKERNYQNEKEPMGVVDVLLTILLIIVILVVIYYIIYVIVLHSTYPTFIDDLFDGI